MRQSVWRSIIFVCIASLAGSALAAIPASERAVLVTLYDTTNGASWVHSDGWKGAAGTECGWYGVTCDAGQATVTGIDLSWNNVAGPIPTSIKNLTNLELFNLTANPLSGSFPNELTQLPKLRVLNLGEFYGNPLGGAFPAAVSNLTNLEQLDLSGNHFTGPIPPSLANLAKLQRLTLWVNELSGPIPAALLTRTTLVKLDLSYNSLSGSLPSNIALPNLEELILEHNQLTGVIPASLGSLTKLRILNLGSNELTGGLPAELGNLNALESFSVYGNQLTGGVPATFGNLTNLTSLDFGYNPISGPIPATIGNLQKLKLLSFYRTNVGGTIPAGLFTLLDLETLYLNDSYEYGVTVAKLSGRFADFLPLTKLRFLDIGSQEITGPIPPEIVQLAELRSIGAHFTPLGGHIPAEFGQLPKLTNADLTSSGITGPIPESFGQLSLLETLSLADNAIGTLPASFSSLSSLKGLLLNNCGLTGTVPTTITDLPNIEYLELRDNKLSGPIPPALFNLAKLQFLDVAANDLTGVIPPLSGLVSLYTLRLDQNQLSGPIPSDIGQLTKLAELNLSVNRLSGPIPPFPNPSALRNINLYDNDLSGGIPNLGKLTSLEELSLEQNRLTGPIPASFGSLTKLQHATLAYNALAGQIPKEIANCTSMADQGLYIDHNALVNNDSSITAYLARTAPGFDQRQTVPPSGVKVSAIRARSLVLSWTPIAYTSFNGGYIISVATSANGPFSAAVTTPDKSSSTFTLDGLQPSTPYFVRVSTATYSNPENKNTVLSAPSAVVSTSTSAGAPAPASVVVLRYGGGIYQYADEGGRVDSYTIANVGDISTSITLTQEGSFFTQNPTSFTLAAGKSQDVEITGLARPEGGYNGASIPSGIGVPAGLRIPVRLLSSAPVPGTVNAVASTNRVDVVAESSQTSLPASVSFTNTGTATLTGILVSEAAWIAPPQGIVTIAPGQTIPVNFTVDRTRRADAAELSGTAISSMSLVYPTGSTPGARTTHDGSSSTGVSLVAVVDTVKPPTASVPFPSLQPGEVPLFLPGVGHVGGGSDLFVSDFSVVNAFGPTALGDIRVYYTPAVGFPLLTSVTNANAVSPGQSLTLADVVKSTFNADQVGTLQVRSIGWSNLSLISNLVNVTNGLGTYGATIPTFRADRSAEPGASIFINGLKKNATTRTNIFIQETGGADANADLLFYDASGNVIAAATSTATIPSFQLVRLTDAVPEGAVRAKITNSNGSSGRIAAYATPVDLTSGDFWSLTDWSRVYASLPTETQVIPVVGKLYGVNGAYFRSDVSISATGDGPAAVAVKLFYDRGLRSAEADVNLAAGETRVLEDVIGTLFPTLTGSIIGCMHLTPSAGTVAVSSRSYATQEEIPGSYATAIPSLPLSRAIRLGQSRVLAGIDASSEETSTARTPSTFRTNLFLVEASGAPAKVRLTVVYADRSQLAFGSRLFTKTIDLAANEFYRANVSRLIAETNPEVDDLRSVQLELRVIDGDGAVFAITSSVDNGSADQVLRVE